MTNLPAVPYPRDELVEGYGIDVTPLKGRSTRSDWHATTSLEPSAMAAHDITARLRSFFADLTTEADGHAGDPIALTNALTRVEAMLADLRFARDHVKTLTAKALADQQVRRLTIDHVGVVEAGTTADRTDWQHETLLATVMQRLGIGCVNTTTGELLRSEDVAHQLLEFFAVNYWRTTPMNAMGLDPDDYSTIDRDEDDKPVRTPTVQIKDNSFRKPEKEGR